MDKHHSCPFPVPAWLVTERITWARIITADANSPLPACMNLLKSAIIFYTQKCKKNKKPILRVNEQKEKDKIGSACLVSWPQGRGISRDQGCCFLGSDLFQIHSNDCSLASCLVRPWKVELVSRFFRLIRMVTMSPATALFWTHCFSFLVCLSHQIKNGFINLFSPNIRQRGRGY